jgi:subtilisin family serine protease
MRKLIPVLALLVGCAAPDPVAVTGPVGTVGSNVGQSKQVYLVHLERGANREAVAASVGGSVRRRYQYAINGFSAQMSEEAAAALARNPNVISIEPDGVVTLVQPNQIGISALPSSWGLDRIDQRNVDLNSTYNPPNGGAGVTVYVIDTGIWTSHIDFGGRATWGPDFTGHYLNYDCNGHGTHVAGTIGGAYYGVAKQVQLVSVRVFTCSGSATFETIIAAVDWVTGNAVKPAVANLSLGGPYTQILNDAVGNSIASGIVYAIAAGNNNTDACTQSPASVASALTVGAIALDDRRAEFSNQGPCVDLFAPGYDIFSDWTGQDQWYTYLCGNSCVQQLSGTSMAAPHVAGVAAQLLSRNPTATPAQVHAAIVSQATPGTLWYNLTPGTPSLVLFATETLGGTAPEPPPTTDPPPPPPPVDDARFSASCVGRSCTFTAVSDGGWTFGDGTSGNGTVVSHLYQKGSYTVRHTVGDAVFALALNCNPKNRCQ